MLDERLLKIMLLYKIGFKVDITSKLKLLNL